MLSPGSTAVLLYTDERCILGLLLAKEVAMIQLTLFHPATLYGRAAYLVQSATRPEVQHLVDFEGHESEPVVCTCEAFIQGGMRPCPHISSALLYVPV